jgi:quinol monooxygenase YgiN
VSDPGIILVADVHGLVGEKGELASVLAELAEGAHAEQDCVSFRVLAAEEPGDFLMLASWRSEEALRNHYATAHYRRYRGRVGPLLARPSDVLVHHLSATIQALDPNPPDPGKFD